jgi:exodeoxyribonuclease V
VITRSQAATTIEVNGKTIELSPDQESALEVVYEELMQRRESMLAGAAGTGKTTVMFAIVERWRKKQRGRVWVFCPTGKAANRAKEVVAPLGIRPKTIHSGHYSTVDEEENTTGRKDKLRFGEPHIPRGVQPGDLVIIDEGSMVNQEIAAVVRSMAAKGKYYLLIIGDHEQLPPVEGTWGFKLGGARAKLERVHRQALESPVLELATLIREGRSSRFTRWGDGVYRHQQSTIETAVKWAEEGREADALMRLAPKEETRFFQGSRVLLTFTNQVRLQANAYTRHLRGYPAGKVMKGETLLCTMNQHNLGIMNGESFVAGQIEPCEPLTECLGQPVVWVTEARDFDSMKPRKFLVLPHMLDAYDKEQSEKKLNRAAWRPLWARKKPRPGDKESAFELMHRLQWDWEELIHWRDQSRLYGLQAAYGYCLTVHKSQGSQWPEVGFISCPIFRRNRDQEFKRRFIYTAVTRAETGFHAFLIG